MASIYAANNSSRIKVRDNTLTFLVMREIQPIFKIISSIAEIKVKFEIISTVTEIIKKFKVVSVILEFIIKSR